MKLVKSMMIVGLIAASGVALAKEGVQDPTVKARMDMMGSNGQNTKILSDMAGDKAAFDADAAAAAKAALMANAADIPAKFEAEADDPVSEARPDIWMNWESFTAKAKDLENAAAALDVATLDSLKAGMGAIGGACKSCHTDFKAKR